MNMKHPKQLLAVLLMGAACTMQAQRSEALLEKNWKFSKGDFKEASQPEFNDTKWESVVIPLVRSAGLIQYTLSFPKDLRILL